MQKLSGKREGKTIQPHGTGISGGHALENNKNCTEEVIFQVKGQRQTKNTFEKKVFFACFFSVQNREWARKAGRFRRR